MKPEVPESAEQLRFSLVTLMNKAEMGARNTAERAGLHEKTINNLVNARHDPRLSVIERVARVFGLKAWQLLRPGNAEDLANGGTLDKLIRDYLAASDRGKENIARVAELEARAQGGPQSGPEPPLRPVNGGHPRLKP